MKYSDDFLERKIYFIDAIEKGNEAEVIAYLNEGMRINQSIIDDILDINNDILTKVIYSNQLKTKIKKKIIDKMNVYYLAHSMPIIEDNTPLINDFFKIITTKLITAHKIGIAYSAEIIQDLAFDYLRSNIELRNELIKGASSNQNNCNNVKLCQKFLDGDDSIYTRIAKSDSIFINGLIERAIYYIFNITLPTPNKAKNAIDPEAAQIIRTDEFILKLTNQGYIVEDVAGDGNCFFHAIELQLKEKNIPYTHLQFREIAANYIRDHPEIYLTLLPGIANDYLNTPIYNDLVDGNIVIYVNYTYRSSKVGEQR